MFIFPIFLIGGTMATASTASHPDQLAQIEHLLEHFEQIETQYQQVRDGLAHSHRLATLGTIATIIAHEYNNILTPIISYAQLALANPDNHGLLIKTVKKSLAGCERAAHISSSLLGFVSDADDQQMACLRTTIDDTITCLARDPKKDGINLTIDVADIRVAMSPLNLQQVLLNLILNAKQAMCGTGGKLRIGARVEGSMVEIEVVDTGPGIPAQILGRLFEPFVTHRHGPSREPEERKGTGLGLYICRDLIQHAGGTISVDNASGQGATFHITLPMSDDLFQTT